ncbi:uncharacterized protein MELLADRAFT_20598 [Melampsora larici-populina 98AG31]|uniref:Secreted protein n=1 Tax=Melampsora larici-populina (strain 98AG31 / pathotype 3-4-7) TaxID=747676 RepID=F4SBP1_MELLP|nr:uncharacterized protein MELLADRAFT_20598 [Melampsora larici-populina 98AG31]EGF97939.1 hypothetical protein MELLADRAFT_20598 [Melampsora larici-populina 98AG31]
MTSRSNIERKHSIHFFLCVLLLSPIVLGHSFILAIEGANGHRSSGFGTRFTTRGTLTQFTGIIKEEEIKTGAVTPCGRIFGGDSMKGFVVNIQEEFRRAENDGLPLARHDGSLVMSVFVHNRDGAGPFACDYSADLTMKSLKPMTISHQIEGDKGINEASKDFVYPLTSVFPPEAVCLGGKTKDACVIRCVNPKGFGSCAAVRLNRQAFSNKIIYPPPQKANNPLQPLRTNPFDPAIANTHNPNKNVPINTTHQTKRPPTTSAKNSNLPIISPNQKARLPPTSAENTELPITSEDQKAVLPFISVDQNITLSGINSEKDMKIITAKSLGGPEPYEYPNEADGYPNESNQYPNDPNQYPNESNQYPKQSNQYPKQSNQYPDAPIKFASGDFV